MGRGTFGNILKISWLIWKIPLVSTSYFSLVPKGVFFWVVNRKDGALQHLDRVDLWHEKEKRSRSWWHDTGFAITVTPNKAFFTKKNFFSSRVVKTVVCWIFIQKTSDSVTFSLIEKNYGKTERNETPVLVSSRLWEIYVQILPFFSPQRWTSASNILAKAPEWISPSLHLQHL